MVWGLQWFFLKHTTFASTSSEAKVDVGDKENVFKEFNSVDDAYPYLFILNYKINKKTNLKYNNDMANESRQTVQDSFFQIVDELFSSVVLSCINRTKKS